jgi:hypothetical protein
MKMTTKIPPPVPLSRLKGISVYFENDLYDLALLTLKLYDARAAYMKTKNIKVRMTMNGLAMTMAELIDACHPDYDKVFTVVKTHGFDLAASIDYDTE